MLQPSVLWCSVQVRDLNRTVESSGMLPLQVYRVFFPIWRPISSPQQKNVNTGMPESQEQWLPSQSEACLWRGRFSPLELWCCVMEEVPSEGCLEKLLRGCPCAASLLSKLTAIPTPTSASIKIILKGYLKYYSGLGYFYPFSPKDLNVLHKRVQILLCNFIRI